jgi:hypothetical protein
MVQPARGARPRMFRKALPSRVGSRRALLAADHRGRVWEPFEGSHVNDCHGRGKRHVGSWR